MNRLIKIKIFFHLFSNNLFILFISLLILSFEIFDVGQTIKKKQKFEHTIQDIMDQKINFNL